MKKNIAIKTKTGTEEGKKLETIHVNKQLLGDNILATVTLDNIRKELMSIEEKYKKNGIKYEYLTGENVKRLVKEYFDDGRDKNYKSISLNMHKVFSGALKPSPPVPKTSSTVIGWRSSLYKHNLEIFGSLYVSPRHTIVPLTSSEISYQRIIYLG